MSDEAVTFDCPACGAPLGHQRPINNLLTCSHCGKQVIMPESLRKPATPSATVIQVGDGGMRIEMGAGETPEFKVQKVEFPQAQRQAGKLPRWVSCFVIATFLLILGSAALSFIAPLVVARLISGEMARIVPGAGGDSGVTLPNISPTIDAVLTQAVQSQAVPTPGMASEVLVFGEEGIGPGMFSDSRWVGVDPAGSLYTAEYQDGRVQKFAPDGKPLALWNVKSKVPLLDLAVDRQGTLYVVQQGEIFKFDAESGAALGSVAYAGAHYFDSVAAAADGGLAAISDGDDLLRFDAAGQVILSIPDAISSITGSSELGARVALDGLGTMYVLGSNNGGVFVFSPEGQYQTRIGSEGNEPDQLSAAHDVAVDGQGRLFVSDIKGVMVFSADGRYQGTIDVEGAPFGLAIDDQNRLVVMTNAPKVYILEIGAP